MEAKDGIPDFLSLVYIWKQLNGDSQALITIIL